MTNEGPVNREEITRLVVSSLADVLEERGKPPQEPLGESTVLLGRQSVVDSLGLVSLLVDLEQRLHDERGATVTLADEKAMSRQTSPFRTVESLVDRLCALLEEQRHG
jgi:acyl carrier protein